MADTNNQSIDGLDTPAIVTAGLVAALGTFVIIIGLQAAYLHFEAQYRISDETRGVSPQSASVLAEQQSSLNQYGWISREKGIVAIPIDRAIEITAEELDVNKTAVDSRNE